MKNNVTSHLTPKERNFKCNYNIEQVVGDMPVDIMFVKDGTFPDITLSFLWANQLILGIPKKGEYEIVVNDSNRVSFDRVLFANSSRPMITYVPGTRHNKIKDKYQFLIERKKESLNREHRIVIS